MQGLIRHERSDETLVEEARAGDDLSFAVLFERYHDRIETFVTLRVGGDRATAEDLTQDVFIAALRGIHANDATIVFKPWIYEIARNVCVDQHRRTTRRAVVVPLEDERAMRAPGRSAEPEREAEMRELFHELRRAIHELPARQRELLALRELGGLSYNELADRAHTSVGAVETALHRARRTLQMRLGRRPAAAPAAAQRAKAA
jgi:RNA polymerase sigma-70 factor (ECF subfamily)